MLCWPFTWRKRLAPHRPADSDIIDWMEGNALRCHHPINCFIRPFARCLCKCTDRFFAGWYSRVPTSHCSSQLGSDGTQQYKWLNSGSGLAFPPSNQILHCTVIVLLFEAFCCSIVLYTLNFELTYPCFQNLFFCSLSVSCCTSSL